jgi:hypothetical protein
MNFPQNWLVVLAVTIALTGCYSTKPPSAAVKQPYQRFVPIPAGAVMPDIPGGTGYYALDTKTGTLCRTVPGAANWGGAPPTCKQLLAENPD